MSEEYLINFTPQETRVALMQQGVVQEVHVERSASRGIVGNIYLGRVVRVLPGMQSAFMDVGLERTAFLHVADIWSDRHAGDALRPIERILAEGQNLIVQVLKDPIGTKGTGPDKSFADLLVNLPEPIQLLLASLEGYTLSLGDDVQRKELRLYLAFKRLKNFATVVLHRGDGAAVLARMQELLGKRREKQPLEWPSAGSTFKRPQGAFAGKLIEDCGLRGFTVGGAQISEKHCGFVINRGGATCADVVALTEQVRQIVEARTGFVLEREIRVVK